MIRRLTVVSLVLFAAFGVLFTSVFRTASVKYDFSGPVDVESRQVLGDEAEIINYEMPFPGKVLPDSPLWPLKALRDRIWLWSTTNDMRQAEVMLLFADKRIASSEILFEKGDYEIGYTTLTKAEKYLEEASRKEEDVRKMGGDTSQLLERLSSASLKHFLMMSEMIDLAPDDAKPKIIETQNYAKRVFENKRNALLEKGINPPENPFDWR